VSSDDRARRVERQLAAAQQITHLGSWEWDVRTNVVSWSDELYRIYGLEPQSRPITFEFFLSCLHPDDRPRVQREVGLAMERGSRFAYPERILRPDGSIRLLDTIGEPARDADGQVVGLIGTCRDVTDEHRRDETIRLYADIVRNVQIGLAVFEVGDPRAPETFRLVAYNPEAERTARKPLDDQVGKTLFEVLPYSEGGPLPTLLSDVARDGQIREVIQERARNPAHRDRAVAMKAFPLPGGRVGLAVDDITTQTRLALERAELAEQLRELSAHLDSVREDERTVISREIHDELGQALTALKLDMAWLSRRIAGESNDGVLLERIRGMSEMTDDVIDRVRRISGELRPGVLDDLGLLAAIEWQGQEFEKRTGTSCFVTSNLGDEPVERGLSTAVFRISQEALTNVARHTKATHVDVRLDRKGGSLWLEVHDDGGGISPEAAQSPRSLGLLGMRERAHRLGGVAQVAAGPHGGTTVSVEVPLKRSPS
jgi:PAS domain S-box-containing protein